RYRYNRPGAWDPARFALVEPPPSRTPNGVGPPQCPDCVPWFRAPVAAGLPAGRGPGRTRASPTTGKPRKARMTVSLAVIGNFAAGHARTRRGRMSVDCSTGRVHRRLDS